MKLDWQTILSIISALGAVGCAFYAYFAIKVQRRINMNISNYTYSSLADVLIKENPELLELHGIDLNILQKYVLKPIEVVYLIQSFNAGDLYYRLGGSKKMLTRYRIKLLENEKVRNAWKHVIKNKLVFGSVFIDLIDEHLNSKYPE